MAPKKEFDVVVWGATGFTGGLLSEYFASTYGNKGAVKWAIAGRNAAKLEAVRDRLAASNPEMKALKIITADPSDPASLASMAASTKSLAAVAGPFHKVGLGLVGACINASTHYCDITGEGFFVKDSIDKYHEEAKSKGVKIVHSCGFDSLPADLGAFTLAGYAKGTLKEECGETMMLYKKMTPGKFSGGTMNTVLSTMDLGISKLKAMSGPNLLDDPARVGRDGGDPQVPRRLPLFGRWAFPFLLGPHNARIVRRSKSLQAGYYGGMGYVGEYMPAKNPFTAYATSAVTGLFGALAVFPPTRALLRRVVPQPGQGPTREEMEAGAMVAEVATTTSKTGKVARTTCVGQRDSGYLDTARWVGETALCLALQGPELAKAGCLPGGVLTPATAGGAVLAKRLLDTCGLQFTSSVDT